MDTTTSEQVQPLFPGFHPRPDRPTFYDEQRQLWRVFRYAEVQRVLSDYNTFSNDRGGLDPAQPRASTRSTSTNLIAMDPPRHRLYRALVTQAFTPRTIAQLEPRITALVYRLLAAVIEPGEMDVIDDFSYPLSITVIAEMLGVPTADQKQFKLWTSDFFEITTLAAAQAQRELDTYFRTIFAQHRTVPQDDLISALLAAQVDGQHLTDAELSSFCSLLLIAGHDTTRNLIALRTLALIEHPDECDRPVKDPTLIPGAVEAMLRWFRPVTNMARPATVDLEIRGPLIRARATVVVLAGTAHRAGGLVGTVARSV